MLSLKAAFIFAVLGVLFMIKNPLHGFAFLRTCGIITDYEKHLELKKVFYFAKIRFCVGQEEFIFTDTTPYKTMPNLGKIVDVLYNKNNPKEAYRESAFSILFPWFFILIACGILIYNLNQNFVF